MLPSSPNFPGASFHQIHGFLPPSVHFDPHFAMPKTSGNVLTLLQTGPPLTLSTTNTTSSSCLPKKQYFSSLISSASNNPKWLWQTVNELLHMSSDEKLFNNILTCPNHILRTHLPPPTAQNYSLRNRPHNRLHFSNNGL